MASLPLTVYMNPKQAIVRYILFSCKGNIFLILIVKRAWGWGTKASDGNTLRIWIFIDFSSLPPILALLGFGWCYFDVAGVPGAGAMGMWLALLLGLLGMWLVLLGCGWCYWDVACITGVWLVPLGCGSLYWGWCDWDVAAITGFACAVAGAPGMWLVLLGCGWHDWGEAGATWMWPALPGLVRLGCGWRYWVFWCCSWSSNN